MPDGLPPLSTPGAEADPPAPSSSLSEFDLIRRFFTRPVRDAVLGIGDDCALLAPRPGQQLAISTDMLVSGRHFFPDADPYRLGHKALAVNLSDLAAMGAQPRAFTLAIALPQADPAWLSQLAAGMLALADSHGCELIGGDTTRGPLTLSITVFGDVPEGQALRRDAARPGDEIWVSGAVGDARLALGDCRGEWLLTEPDFSAIRDRLEAPQPRVALGMALRGIARAAVDVSDGLLADLGHILQRSGVGARLLVPALPASTVLSRQPEPLRLQCLLAGGDDYELCFTAPAQAREQVLRASREAGVAVACIGAIEAEAGVRLLDASGAAVPFDGRGFDHFASP
ncbi:thiamine-phosphate kinase [Cupriavidus sp. AU9028]|uniref:thiamine-phosphate kinase n=1 Tax=Cupriavidus sp. AU9028 TaxID=2871157 RepID=UPI001C93DF9A|nr:thiamine-phosphate kinase [Cupriavidus sp. AU9028]MBY4897384.1 thiamine-phosphate kinase [Cupriavidus sp. AU9028]